MINIVAWALMNGLIIGAIWIGIVLWSRQKHLDGQQARLQDDHSRRQDQLEDVNQRVAELEQRLDLSERLLSRERQPAPRADN
jgi:type VI protein secretion system component VasK